MAFEIGQNIKRFRKERNLTQEELAELLNITAQAVSKWENGSGMPDISQVVPLAGIFGVSMDALFGTIGTNDDEEVRKIIAAIEEPVKNAPYRNDETTNVPDYHLTAYYACLDALKTYPNNTLLLLNTLGYGANNAIDLHYDKTDAPAYPEIVWNEEKEERMAKFYEESLREANIIINYGKDINHIMSAHMWLVRLYSEFGEYEKAEEHANMFPESYDFTRGAQLAWVKRAKIRVTKTQDEEIKQRCDNLSNLLWSLEMEIISLANAYAAKGQTEDAIRCNETIYDIIDAVYRGEEYTPPMHSMWLPHLAGAYVKLGDIDAAFKWLNKIVDHKIGQGKHYNKRKHIETPLLREREFEFFGTEYHAKEEVLEGLAHSRFDDVRGDPRFLAILDRVNAL